MLQQQLGLTAQQEEVLLETRASLLNNLGSLTAERNTLCQQLTVSFSEYLYAVQPYRSPEGDLVSQ